MAGRAFISRFSPNRTDPQLLEAIFVQRHTLAEVWLGRLRDSVRTATKHHLLAIGPRGGGKSHLVALLVHRLERDPDTAGRVRIAWLPEDETTPSFWKYLLRILRALRDRYPAEFPRPPRDRIKAASTERRAAVLVDYLLQKLGGRTLVVVENLDEVLHGLKAEGQKRWRAFLQERKVAATLATSQRPTRDISDRDRPFFNFFQIEHLRPLTADEAAALLGKIAEHIGNTSLAEFLRTPAGRARVRAIRHLTGGNHRVFITLSEFATREKLDDLVTAAEELLDDLTPYYQERLRWLPDQQREIVEFLCRQTRTVPVKEIAGDLFLSEQAAAAQLKSLKDKGYVTAGSVGRESRYELAEPLMRLCVEVKDPQREPIRLIVEFLRIWYDQFRVEGMLGDLPPDADMERRYLHAVLRAFRQGTASPIDEMLDQDLEAARQSSDPEELVRVLVDVASSTNDLGRCVRAARQLMDRKRREESQSACNRASTLKSEDSVDWLWLALTCSDLDNPNAALLAYDRVIEISPVHAYAWKQRGLLKIFLQGKMEEGVADVRRALDLDLKDSITLGVLAVDCIGRGEWARAEEFLKEFFRLPRDHLELTDFLGFAISLIFRTCADHDTWTYRVGRLSAIARAAQQNGDAAAANAPVFARPDSAGRSSPPATLGSALVQGLTSWGYAGASPDSLDAWTGIWHNAAEKLAAEGHPDLLLSTRLFDAGIRYLQTKDERVLLDLVREERTILRDLFKLGEES